MSENNSKYKLIKDSSVLSVVSEIAIAMIIAFVVVIGTYTVIRTLDSVETSWNTDKEITDHVKYFHEGKHPNCIIEKKPYGDTIICDDCFESYKKGTQLRVPLWSPLDKIKGY